MRERTYSGTQGESRCTPDDYKEELHDNELGGSAQVAVSMLNSNLRPMNLTLYLTVCTGDVLRRPYPFRRVEQDVVTVRICI